jgi:hypothetical protein
LDAGADKANFLGYPTSALMLYKSGLVAYMDLLEPQKNIEQIKRQGNYEYSKNLNTERYQEFKLLMENMNKDSNWPYLLQGFYFYGRGPLLSNRIQKWTMWHSYQKAKEAGIVPAAFQLLFELAYQIQSKDQEAIRASLKQILEKIPAPYVEPVVARTIYNQALLLQDQTISDRIYEKYFPESVKKGGMDHEYLMAVRQRFLDNASGTETAISSHNRDDPTTPRSSY